MKNFKFNWQKIGEVVDFDKNEKHIGCADLLKAQLGNYIVVGGGSNFPNGNVTVGGKRTLNKKIYLFYADNDKIEQVDSIDFSYPFSNGATTTDDNNIYHITANDKNGSDIVKFSIDNNKLSFTIIDSLPFPMENIILEFFEDTLIFGCGKINNELSRTLYRYNLSSKTLETFSISQEMNVVCVYLLFMIIILLFMVAVLA